MPLTLDDAIESLFNTSLYQFDTTSDPNNVLISPALDESKFGGVLPTEVSFSKAALTSLADAANWGGTTTINAATYGAVANDGVDDTAALQAAINAATGKTLVINPGTYRISDPLQIGEGQHNMVISAYNVVIDASAQTDSWEDGLIINGSNTSNGKTAYKIAIFGLEIDNAHRMGFQVYGGTSAYDPHDIAFIDTVTKNAPTAGIYVNEARNILIDGHADSHPNAPGSRGITIQSRPVGAQPDGAAEHSTDIIIKDVTLSGNTGYGIQTYYGRDIIVENATVDGSSLSQGERSAIDIDRSRFTLVTDSQVSAAPGSQMKDAIIINGGYYVSVWHNTVAGGQYGIEGYRNEEQSEDYRINQSRHLVIADNDITGQSVHSIIFHGVTNGIALANHVQSNGAAPAIMISEKWPAGDPLSSPTTGIRIIANDGGGQHIGSDVAAGNSYASNVGLVIDNLKESDTVDGAIALGTWRDTPAENLYGFYYSAAGLVINGWYGLWDIASVTHPDPGVHVITLRDGWSGGGSVWLRSDVAVHLNDTWMEFSAGSLLGETTGLYMAILDREPDKAGLGQHVWEQAYGGYSLEAVAGVMLGSPEYANRFGNPDNSSFVWQVYDNLFHRAPNSQEMQIWLDALANGLSRPSMVVQMVQSSEGLFHISSEHPEGYSAPLPYANELSRLYWTAYDRSLDPGGQRTNTQALLGGQSFASVIHAVAISSEFAADHNAQSNADYVDSLIRAGLKRAPSASEFGYVAQLDNGTRTREGVLSDIVLGSAELTYYGRKPAGIPIF